ncbi:MAG: hypothetical protein KDK36_03685, partial [Leptospiraceae bacterium]|nr:hypothetical protein [Leptospiraceae bacterium]
SLPSDNPIYLHIFPEDQDEHEVSAYLNKDQINKIASLPLKGLSLVRVKTEDLSALGNLKNLIYLSINIYEKDLKFIKKLTSLKSLKLQFISNKDLKYISGLTNLQHLDLRSIMTADFYTNKITDEGLYYLRNLKNLEILHLTYTNIDGSGIKHLSKMKNLRFLNLLQCPIKNENDVKKKLKHIKLLKINFDDMGQL